MNATERNDLLISWITLSVAFALVISENFLNLVSIAEAIPIALVGVGTGFVFHEMAHRNVARRFGFHAEFRAWNNGLILAVAFAVITMGRFTFAAPGATYIFAQNIGAKQNGQISAAGPLTNLIIGFLLLLAAFAGWNAFIFKILLNAAMINFWFAFFNMLPIPPLDGIKVMAWSKAVWAATTAVAAVMVFMPEAVLMLFGAA
jgi:Zn-dependent protease